jgi:hypothetical protein
MGKHAPGTSLMCVYSDSDPALQVWGSDPHGEQARPPRLRLDTPMPFIVSKYPFSPGLHLTKYLELCVYYYTPHLRLELHCSYQHEP